MMTKYTAIADADDDWQSLSDEWQAVPAAVDVEQLRRRVRAQSLRMRWWFAIEVIVTVAAVAVLASAARVAHRWDSWVIIGGLALFTAVIWTFNVRNRRGIWRSASDSLEAYQALEAERRQRRLAAATFTRRICLTSLVPLAVVTVIRGRDVATDGAYPVLICLGAMLYLLAFVAWSRHIERSG